MVKRESRPRQLGLARVDDDGRFGPATQNAILAFQKWERIGRTGLLDGRTKARLATALRPIPRSMGGPGKRAEILLGRQVALLINNNQVVRTIAVSSGKPLTPTPRGTYRVYAKTTGVALRRLSLGVRRSPARTASPIEIRGVLAGSFHLEPDGFHMVSPLANAHHY